MRSLVSRILSKIKEMRRTYCGLRLSGGYAVIPASIRLVQAAYFSVFRKEEYGIMLSYDYIYFKHPEIYRTLFTNKDNAELLPLVNNQEHLGLLGQKHLLPDRLDGMGRRFLLVRLHSAKEVRDFLKRDGGYILKPDEGAGSFNISFLYSEGGAFFHWNPAKGTRQPCGDFHALYESWRAGNMLIEEYIRQHAQLKAIFSGCVNTIFLHTVLLPDGHAELVRIPFMTCGCGESNFVNSGKQITIEIQPDGALAPYGFFQKRDPFGCIQIEKMDRHPDTGLVFGGLQIPYWEEAKTLATASAEKLPELTYIKWDIAISETGPVVIEGNGLPGTYGFWQTKSLAEHKRGVRTELRECFMAISFMKSLDEEKIQSVNRELSQFPTACDSQDCDTVIVLGSTRCTSRIVAAFETYGCNGRYILCGGSASEHLKDPRNPGLGRLTEADYMRRYLLERGAAPERIFTDNASFSTQQNLAHAAELLHRLGSKRAAIVSAWFHSRRVSHLVSQLNYFGLSQDRLCFIPAYGEQTRPDNWFRSFYGVSAIYHEAQYKV